MSFWSGQTLAARAQAEQLIIPFDVGCVECSAYALHVSYEAFVTRDKSDQAEEVVQGRTPGHLVIPPNESFCIPSGQFAFLIAKEKVRIPPDAVGFISLKTRKKFRGLVNVSGFHVDPDWSGRLIFAVFNAGPKSIVIRPDEKLFLLFFANLDEEAKTEYRYNGNSRFNRIPSELMEEMSAPVPTIYKLNDDVRELGQSTKTAEVRSNFALGLAGTAFVAVLALIAVVLRLAWKSLP